MRLSDQEYNRLLLLKKLRASEPVARTDLVGLTGLTGGTITAITADLVRRGLVIEEKVISKTLGRPRVNLRLNPAGRYVIGSTATTEGDLVVEIVNLRGESMARFSSRLAPTTRLADLAGQFADALNRALDESPIAREAIYRVGIGLPAVVDNRAGVVECMATFDPGPCDFAAIVKEAVGIQTFVDNNTNLLARAEHWFGDGAADEFTLILVDLGIGAALYKGGHLVTGAHGIESEFGHVKIMPDTGRHCHCGGRGCLQAHSSISAIVEQCCEALGEPIPDIPDMRPCFEHLMQRHLTGDTRIEAILQQSCHYLGIAVANHITMQDPEAIVILGPSVEYLDVLRTYFFKSLEENVFPSLRRRTRIHFKHPDHGIYARGAAAMVLEHIYSGR
ncbi:ROK family protein [Sphingobium sp. H39-3-25]|uniref:ROK family protein n=1 Tax=Sphingobium arseniciresistens TaxID=3030834 RepID=UPI0023B8F899|nr:ROK family protein [Sphingobium arseniciresistens]